MSTRSEWDANDAESLFEAADLARDSGTYGEAERFYKLALDAWQRQCSYRGGEARHPPYHQFTANIINALACTVAEQGELDKAENLFVEALQIHRSHSIKSEEDGKSMATILQNLGELAVVRRNWLRAASLYTESLCVPRSHTRAVHDKILSCGLAKLAMISVELQKLDSALFYLSAWCSSIRNSSLSEQVQAEQNEDVTRAIFGLGARAEEHGNTEQAEMLYQTCLSVLRYRRSNELPCTALTADVLFGLGSVLLFRITDCTQAQLPERLQIAGHLLKESLRARIHSNSVEASDEAVLATLPGLAFVARRQGNVRVAAHLYVQSLSLRRVLTGGSVLDLEDTYTLLARAKQAEDEGRLPVARELYEECVGRCLTRGQRDIEAKSRAVLEARREFTELFRRARALPSGELGALETERLYTSSLEVAQRVLGSVDDELVACVVLELGDIALERGDIQVARHRFDQCICIRRQSLGEYADDLQVAVGLLRKATATLAQGDIIAAAEGAMESLMMSRRLDSEQSYGRDSGSLSSIYNSMESMLGQTESDRVDQAHRLFTWCHTQAHRILSRLSSRTDPHTDV